MIKNVENIKDEKIKISIEGTNDQLYVFQIKPKKRIKVEIKYKRKTFVMLNRFTYSFMINTDTDIYIENSYDQKIEDIDQSIEFMDIFKYGSPKTTSQKTTSQKTTSNPEYNVLYSFDSNYYHGAFASIASLLANFRRSKMNRLNINLCVPEIDYNSVDTDLKRFMSKHKNNPSYVLFLIVPDVMNSAFMNTKCYKGGSHLLKLSNFSRLIVGNIVYDRRLMYIDSDTIIQSDLSKILDKMPRQDRYTVMGKRSELNYTNLINVNNTDAALEFLGGDFDLKKNVIYTGTIIFNTELLNKKMDRMTELVKKHNKTPDGIYKLFTMSVINLGLSDSIGYFDEYLNNVVDLGYKKNLERLIEDADVLDWSGMFKPWFINGLYKEYWIKYNIMYDKYSGYVMYKKDTIESFKKKSD